MDQHAPTATTPSSPTAPAPEPLTKPVAESTTWSDGSLFSKLSGNQFFTAGFGLAALAAVARIGQRGIKHGAELLRRRMLVDVEVTRHDESYEWLLRWITAYQRGNVATEQHRGGGFLSSILRRLIPGLHHLQIQTTRVQRPDGSAQTHFSLIPGPGRHILRYKNAFIAASRQREKAFDTSGKPFETITLTTLYAHRHVFEELFGEAHQLAQRMHEGKTVILTSWGTEWRSFGEPKRKRPLDSVVLERGVKERVVDDVRAFLDARTWYLDRGIPYRRGYLLHGPPGTGKSSFIQALAGALDFSIGILNLGERGLTDDRLNHLLTNVPPRTIVLLEDADAAFRNRAESDEHGYRGPSVTFSGLLNALDGVASAEERVIVLTTNHVDRLDEALIRPGRVDMTVRLGEATEWQIDQLWDRFYADLDADGSGKRRFMARVKELGLVDSISTAALQGLFLYNKSSTDGAIAMADSLATHGHLIVRGSN